VSFENDIAVIRGRTEDPKSSVIVSSTAMITGPYRNRRYMIASVLSRRSSRLAAGASGGRQKANLRLLLGRPPT